MSKHLQSVFDTGAVIISAVCAIHCLALPLVLVLFPLLGSTVLADEHFHELLLWVILPTSVIAVGLALRNHRDNLVLALVGTGLMLLLLGALWAHDNAPHWVDLALSLAGGAVLAVGHIRNFMICRKS